MKITKTKEVKLNKILIIQTMAFNPNKGGVQRITYNLGKYFTEHNLEVHYFSFENSEHVEVNYGVLHSANEKGGLNNRSNLNALNKLLHEVRFNFIINQVPYEKKLRSYFVKKKVEYDFFLICCIHNSLFNFKSNARDILLYTFPSPINKLIAIKPMIAFVQIYHKIKHARDLKSIIDSHDLLLLYTPPNYEELKYFVGNYKKEKIGYMPNPVLHVPELNTKKENLILHVGRINIPQKRSDLLLDFWALCCNEIPDWEFVIVGDGPYLKQLEKELKTRQLPRVKLEGFRQPEPYYHRASIFMMPSAFEGFPNTVIEAHSYGCPVVAFDSYAALRWIVKDQEDALLCKPFDINQMAKETTKLAQNKSRLFMMQQKAQVNASRFVIKRIGQQWLDLLKS